MILNRSKSLGLAGIALATTFCGTGGQRRNSTLLWRVRFWQYPGSTKCIGALRHSRDEMPEPAGFGF
jgi:hypothetical protein